MLSVRNARCARIYWRAAPLSNGAFDMTILTLDLRRADPPGSGSKGAGCLGFGARLKRVSVAFATLLAALFVVTNAYAWPDRPVTVIVPYAAGGNTDTMARLVSEWLSVQLKQRFVVENRAGAGGTLAAAFVAQSKPDGYTLLFGAAPQLLIAPLIQKVAYDARKDFAPVAVFGTGPHVMAVHASVPAKTIGEFIAYAKANPGKVNYASGGQGTSGHLHGALFASRAGLDMVHVPYRGGAPATAAGGSGADVFRQRRRTAAAHRKRQDQIDFGFECEANATTSGRADA
jgi:hypothetical protein